MSQKTALLSALRQAYGPSGWHGPTVLRVLRGVGPRVASKRVWRGRNTIWELTLHLAYWTHVARERITGRRTPFRRTPANFPAQPRRPDPRAWTADVALLRAEHAALVRVVRRLSPKQLAGRVGRWSVADTILGVALHDTYHAGQMRYLRRVIES